MPFSGWFLMKSLRMICRTFIDWFGPVNALLAQIGQFEVGDIAGDACSCGRHKLLKSFSCRLSVVSWSGSCRLTVPIIGQTCWASRVLEGCLAVLSMSQQLKAALLNVTNG